MLRFEHPLLLLALVAVAAVGVALHLTLGRPATPRWVLWTALYAGSGILVTLALALPQLRTAARPDTMLVIDRSASVDANLRDTEIRWAAADRSATSAQPRRVIRFGGGAQVVAPTAAGLSGSGPQPAASAVGPALQTALARVPRGGRIVVLSDGWTTDRTLEGQIAAARLKDVSVDTVTLHDPRFRYAAVTQVHAPQAVHIGDPVPLQVTIRSSVTEPARLALIRDGTTVGRQTVNLRTGDNPLLLSYTASRGGWHSYQVRVALLSNDMPVDVEREAIVHVVGAARVALVGSGASPVGTELSRLGFDVSRIAPAAVPTTAGGWTDKDAVVLDDVPATALSRAQMSALAAAVRTGGLGMFALGGPHSFSVGRYSHTPLDSLLPVSSLVPGNLQRKNVAIELVLDHSGSMIDLAGGVPKIQMVHVAGAQTAKFVAAHHDSLGIVDFDIAAHVVVPMQSLSGRAAARRVTAAVSRLQPSGGTNVYAGMLAGLNQLLQSPVPDKHLILMTDGISEPKNYTSLLATLKRYHIQVATVALGTDAQKRLLYQIARATGGRYYYTNDAHRLPVIFGKETRFDVKPVKVSGRLTVTSANDSPVVRSLAGRALPPLTGNVVTNLKSGAQTDLLAAGTGSHANPALAQWQYGAGRVVALTPGLGAPWARAWSGRTQLVNDAVRWAERGVTSAQQIPTVLDGSPPTLQLNLGQSARAVTLHPEQVAATLTSTAGRRYPVVLRAVAPGLYQAPLTGLAQGTYEFALDGGSSPAGVTSGLIAVPYASEYLPRSADDSPLGPLAALTGGRALPAGDPGVLARGGWQSVWWIPALAGLLLFVAGALGRVLEPSRSGGPPGAGSYNSTSPADRAASVSTSSAETSVGART